MSTLQNIIFDQEGKKSRVLITEEVNGCIIWEYGRDKTLTVKGFYTSPEACYSVVEEEDEKPRPRGRNH